MAGEDGSVIGLRLDRFIGRLARAGGTGCVWRVPMEQDELITLCNDVIPVLRRDPMLIEVEPPVRIFGDIHGQFADLLQWQRQVGGPTSVPWLCLGDYVDRGPNSLETIAYLLALKCRYPEQLWLLRGNHETAEMARVYGFYDECHDRFDDAVYNAFIEVFHHLPLAACVGGRVLCVHGGLSPEWRFLEQLSWIQRPLEVPDRGLVMDLLWADPGMHCGFQPSDRGASYTYGLDAVQEFLERNDKDFLCRSHQACEGFMFNFEPEQAVVTVFSAPNYCGAGNKAAVLCVDETLKCTFSFLEARPPRAASISGIGRLAQRACRPGTPVFARRPAEV